MGTEEPEGREKSNGGRGCPPEKRSLREQRPILLTGQPRPSGKAQEGPKGHVPAHKVVTDLRYVGWQEHRVWIQRPRSGSPLCLLRAG